MLHKQNGRDIAGKGLLLVSAVLLCISVFLCFSNDIWYDELFTMGLGNQSLGNLISMTARDVHPPLYYMIVKLALYLVGTVEGSMNQVVIAKLVSVLPFFLCLVYAGTVVRKQFGWLSAGLFGFLLLTMPNLSGYTVEVRMYGYAVFFITAAMLHAYLIEQNNSYVDWIALTFYALAACYTHYFACVAACMVFLYVFVRILMKHHWREKGKLFVMSAVICTAGYLPWLLQVVSQQVEKVSENYWIQPLGWRTLGGCVKYLFQPATPIAAVNVLIAVIGFAWFGVLILWMLIKERKKSKAASGQDEATSTEACKTAFILGGLGVLGGLVLFGFAASVLIRPIFVYRYMLPAMGVFWLALTILLVRLADRKYLLGSALALLILIGLCNYHSFYGEEMWKRIQMKNVESAFSELEEEAVIICNFDQTQGVAAYYLKNSSYLWYGTPEELICEMYPQSHSLVEDFSDEAGIARIQELLQGQKPFYFFGSGNSRDEILEKWKEAGITADEISDVMLERYWFKIYRIGYHH